MPSQNYIEEIKEIWNMVKESFRSQLSETSIDLWFGEISVVSFSDPSTDAGSPAEYTLTLGIPSEFKFNIVKINFSGGGITGRFVFKQVFESGDDPGIVFSLSGNNDIFLRSGVNAALCGSFLQYGTLVFDFTDIDFVDQNIIADLFRKVGGRGIISPRTAAAGRLVQLYQSA